MTIAKGVSIQSHWPAFDIDSKGNLYVAWDENGGGTRPAGVYYSYSTNAGRTWARPIRVDRNNQTDRGAAARYGSRGSKPPRSCPTTNAETPGEHGWRIQVAQSLNGHGCRGAAVPGFRTSLATKEPVHTGTICNSGTVCQAQGIDRRMGDYFTVAVDAQGRLVAGLLGHAARRCRGPACVLPAGGRSQLRPQHLLAVGVSRDSRGHTYGGRAASGPSHSGRRRTETCRRVSLGWCKAPNEGGSP